MPPAPSPWNRIASVYEVETNEARRITTMEGARGFAVALVFLVHYHAGFSTWSAREPLTDAIAKFLWTIGHSGVDLFFVLSGYLIYGAAIKPSLHYGRFMKRRVQRIYPTFLVVLAVYLLLSFIFPSESKLPDRTLPAIAYVVQNALLLPGLFPIEPMISVAWSLSYEFFFYLTLPVLVLALRLQRWQPRTRVIFWTTAASLFVASWFLLRPQAPRMLAFIAGILVYEGLHSFGSRSAPGRWKEWTALVLALAAFASFPFLEPLPDGELYRTIISAIAFGFLVLTLFRAEGPLRPAFSWTPMRWLGNMSYSYYLIHALAINACALVLQKVLPQSLQTAFMFWLMMLPVFVATLVASTLLFALVEKPFSLVARRKYAMPVTAETVAP
jgi:exopolysaccharide production protein ExoZ